MWSAQRKWSLYVYINWAYVISTVEDSGRTGACGYLLAGFDVIGQNIAAINPSHPPVIDLLTDDCNVCDVFSY